LFLLKLPGDKKLNLIADLQFHAAFQPRSLDCRDKVEFNLKSQKFAEPTRFLAGVQSSGCSFPVNRLFTFLPTFFQSAFAPFGADEQTSSRSGFVNGNFKLFTALKPASRCAYKMQLSSLIGQILKILQSAFVPTETEAKLSML
jgi:hypothetical protein